MRDELRKVLAEIIEPGGGDDEKVEIEDPNSPENKAKRDKMENKPHAVGIQMQTSSKRKSWMPGY
jgi:hypothetical protein